MESLLFVCLQLLTFGVKNDCIYKHKIDGAFGHTGGCSRQSKIAMFQTKTDTAIFHRERPAR